MNHANKKAENLCKIISLLCVAVSLIFSLVASRNAEISRYRMKNPAMEESGTVLRVSRQSPYLKGIPMNTGYDVEVQTDNGEIVHVFSTEKPLWFFGQSVKYYGLKHASGTIAIPANRYQYYSNLDKMYSQITPGGFVSNAAGIGAVVCLLVLVMACRSLDAVTGAI